MFRQKEYNREERKQNKTAKKRNWSNKGGYIAPIMVPSTPDGELARMLRSVIENEAEEGMKFKIVETPCKQWVSRFDLPGR